MADETFEYAIKNDVRNNPITREVDSARQRALWKSAAVGMFLVAVVLFSAWQHFELLRFGYQFEELQEERARQAEINRHLRLEVETLRSPARIEKLAIEQLGMVPPPVGGVTVIERVKPSAVVPPSVLAQR